MRLIVTGGGTGGHLFPGIAVAEGIKKKFPERDIMFIGTGRHIDNKALTGRGFQVVALECQGLKGKNIIQSMRSMLKLPASLFASMRVIKKFAPDLVFGVGGYVTGPVILAARMLGFKTCIHEQNSVPGIANRILGKIVHRIYISIPGSEGYFPQKRTVMSGNPVRKEILSRSRTVAEKKPSEGKTLLVLGGSQGAHKVNILVSGTISGMSQPRNLRVIHQTGTGDEGWVRDTYEKAKVAAEVAAFFDNMPELYAKADLVVSRAGATTLAELAVMGKPSILIPFPYAADDHQSRNAQYLVEAGAAIMEQEKDLNEERLRKLISSLLADSAKMELMAKQALRLAKPDATEEIIKDCMAFVPAAA